jgi:ribosomal protein L23
MALFSTDTKKKTANLPAAGKARKVAKATAVEDGRLSGVLKAPWFSEKALIASERGVYVFQVPADATKTQILDAIEKFYKVRPAKVAIANLPAKSKSLRSRRGTGTSSRRHKAYVYMKKGETITLA